MRITTTKPIWTLLFCAVLSTDKAAAFHTRATTLRRAYTSLNYYKSGEELSCGGDAAYDSIKEGLVSDLRQQHQEFEKEQQQVISQSVLMINDDSNNVQLAQQQQEEEASSTANDNTPLSDVNKARLLLLGAAALYGTNFSLVKILGETGMSVGLSSTLRFGFATLATLPWLLQISNTEEESKGQQQQQQNNQWLRIFDPQSIEFQAAMGGLEVGMWNSIGYVAQAVGLETTSASKSAFLCSMAVVVVPILDYLQGKKLLNKQIWGVILAICGVAFLEFEDAANIQAALQLSPGDIASLIQPLAFGLGFWRMESVMRKHPEEASRSTAAQLLAVFLGSLTYMCATSFTDPSTIPQMDQFVTWITDPTILMSLVWTGVITTALTIYMETLALKTLSAAETTLIFSTEPLWGTAFAGVVMGETLGLNAALGAVCILSGCLYSNLGLKGILSFLPGMQSPPSETDEATRFLEEDKFVHEQHGHQSMLPTNGPFGKFSPKSSIAGGLTGLIASVQMAHSATTFVPDELQDFLEKMS